MKTVLLINPNDIRPPVAPLALEYISSSLNERGHYVVLYDMNIHKDKLSKFLERVSPHCVGFWDVLAMSQKRSDRMHAKNNHSS